MKCFGDILGTYVCDNKYVENACKIHQIKERKIEMKRFYRGMSLFFAIALMLSLLSIPTAALPSGSQDYIVVGGSGTFSVYQAASGTTDYSQYSKISDFSTMTLALNYIGNLVQDGSTTITFGETFSSADGPSGWCDVGSDVAAVNGGGMSFSIGSSGTYTVKGKLTGSGDYVLSFQMYLIGIIDGAEIQSTSTSANSCAVASIMSDVTVKPGSVITASTGSALHMFDAGAAYIEGGTLTGGTSESAIYDESIHALNISGGTVSSDSTYAVYNSGTGAVNISGGAVRSSASNTIYNNSTGKITISDQADISTSSRYAAVWLHGGTSGETILEMTGGTVSNTNASSFQLTDANVPTAIGNGSVGTVLISGGSIQSTGFGVGSSSSAVLKISGGTINVGENGFGVANGSTGGVFWVTDHHRRACQSG